MEMLPQIAIHLFSWFWPFLKQNQGSFSRRDTTGGHRGHSPLHSQALTWGAPWGPLLSPVQHVHEAAGVTCVAAQSCQCFHTVFLSFTWKVLKENQADPSSCGLRLRARTKGLSPQDHSTFHCCHWRFCGFYKLLLLNVCFPFHQVWGICILNYKLSWMRMLSIYTLAELLALQPWSFALFPRPTVGPE